MKHMTTKQVQFVKRGRPIDATGLFWSFVFVLYVCFHASMHFGRNDLLFAGVVLLVIIPGVLWQLRIWKSDSMIDRQAMEWCREHYPEYVDTAVLDLMISLADNLTVDFSTLKSSTLLVDLVLDSEGSANLPAFETSEMLKCIANDARIRGVDWSSFSGTTLGDAIQFLVES